MIVCTCTVCGYKWGYTDDSDKDLNARDDVDLWLAGCVPDSYGVDVHGKWYYPKRRSGNCNKGLFKVELNVDNEKV